MQVPRRAGGQPSTYLQPPLGGVESAGITSVDSTPLYPFGYGASYISFQLDEVRASADKKGTDEAVEVCAGAERGIAHGCHPRRWP